MDLTMIYRFIYTFKGHSNSNPTIDQKNRIRLHNCMIEDMQRSGFIASLSSKDKKQIQQSITLFKESGQAFGKFDLSCYGVESSQFNIQKLNNRFFDTACKILEENVNRTLTFFEKIKVKKFIFEYLKAYKAATGIKSLALLLIGYATYQLNTKSNKS